MLTRLGHTNSTINNSEGIVGLVRNNVNEKLGLGIELALVSQAIESNLIQSL